MVVRLVLRRLLLTTAVVFGLSIARSAGQGKENPETGLDLREAVQQRLQSLNKRFKISGKVVDQDGNLVNEVSVAVDRSRATGPFAEKEYSESRLVDGTFEFSFGKSSYVGLSFRKDDYHWHRLEFVGKSPSKEARVRDDTHIYEGITVVLHKIGNLTSLHSYGCLLSYRFDGAVQAWDLSNVAPERKETSTLELDSVPVPDVHCVYVHIAESEASIAPVVEANREISPKDGIVQVVLQDGQDGGFIRVPREGRSQKEMLLAMTSAPADGYSPTMNLLASDLAALRRDEIYFYCRINGLYGRGYVNSVLFRPDFGVKSCGLYFLIQPDGSTNVETTSW